MAIGFFACISITYQYFNDYDIYIKTLLFSYFIVDGFVNRNRLDIVLHHTLFAGLTSIIESRILFYKYLLFEWTTLFLMLYTKFNINTQELFAISWFSIRIVYAPFITYDIILYKEQEQYLYLIASTVMYCLFFHWTCKILHRRIETKYGVSSLMLYFFPVLFMLYTKTLSLQTYMLIYYQSMVSFYFHTIREVRENFDNFNIIRALDTSGICYFATKYLTANKELHYLVPISNFFIKSYFEKSEIHTIILIITISKLLYMHNETILFVLPGCYAMMNNIVFQQFSIVHKYVWHFCVSIALAYTLIENK